MARVLILHGWTNRRPLGHWQRNLASALREQGHIVSYPQLPNPDNPELADWLEVLIDELNMLTEVGSRADEELIVVAHSLGCIVWLQASDRGLLPVKANRLLLVAPPEPQPTGTDSPFASFVMEHDLPRIKSAMDQSTHSTTLVGSDADPWQPSGIQVGVGDFLGLTAQIIPGAKHLSLPDGFSQWAGVIDWVNNPEADITKV
jgi:predicted alpha/beta hydrolase family esterase